MRAMVLKQLNHPLEWQELECPAPGDGQVRLRVHACGVCRTDLHVVDGDLREPKLPLIPGHQIVGEVDELGSNVERVSVGDRVGVPWLGYSCGECVYCRAGRENLCAEAKYTGYQIDGGFAEYCLADTRYCFAIPAGYSDVQAAPLLCAGLIGYRAYRMAVEGFESDGESALPVTKLGLYGFGSAAHILTQIAIHDGKEVYAFTRSDDERSQAFARDLGALWVGGSDALPPDALDAAIIFAPVGSLVPAALRAVRPAGVVVCAGIHMTKIPAFSYDLLWQERVVRSVANLTRRDGRESLQKAAVAGIQTTVHTYPLAEVNQALDDLRNGAFEGSAVITVTE